MIFCLYKIFYCDKGTKLLKGNCLKVEERCIKKKKKKMRIQKFQKNQVLFQE